MHIFKKFSKFLLCIIFILSHNLASVDPEIETIASSKYLQIVATELQKKLDKLYGTEYFCYLYIDPNNNNLLVELCDKNTQDCVKRFSFPTKTSNNSNFNSSNDFYQSRQRAAEYFNQIRRSNLSKSNSYSGQVEVSNNPVKIINDNFATLTDNQIAKFQEFDVNSWGPYFAKLNHDLMPEDWSEDRQSGLFKQFYFYQFHSFLNYLKKFPGYSEEIIALQKKIENNPGFRKKLNEIKGWDDSLFSIIKAMAVKIEERVFTSDSQVLEQSWKELCTQKEKEFAKKTTELYVDYPAQTKTLLTQSELQAKTFNKNDLMLEYYNKRIDSLRATLADSNSIVKAYQLPSTTIDFLQKHSIDQHIFEKCHGNMAQLQIHEELIDITNEASKLYQHENIDIKEHAVTTAQFAELACNLNKTEDLQRKYYLTDFCHYSLSFCKGVKKSFGDNYEAIKFALKHPCQKLEQVGDVVFDLGKKMISSLCYFILNPQPDEIYQNKFQDFVNEVTESLNAMPREQKLESFGYLLTDLVIGHYIPKGANKAFSLSKVAGANAITRGTNILKKIGSHEEVAYIIGLSQEKGISKVKEALDLIHSYKTIIQGEILRSKNQFTKLDRLLSLSVERGIEYAENFRQYVDEFLKHRYMLEKSTEYKKALTKHQLPVHFIPAKPAIIDLKILKDGTKICKDKFGNIWKIYRPDIPGYVDQWFIELSETGKKQIGWLTPSSDLYNTNSKKLADKLGKGIFGEFATELEPVIETVEGLKIRLSDLPTTIINKNDIVSNAGNASKAVNIAHNAEALGNLIPDFCITKYDSSIGNLNKLKEAIFELKDIPGILEKDSPLKKVLDCGKIGSLQGELSTARGAMYEIEKALELKKNGEKIIKFGEKIGSREFDIVTKTKLIECKNIDWFKLTEDKIKTMRMIFGNQFQISQELGKIFEVHSKNKIPDDWKNWFIKKQIKFFEG